MSTSSAPPHVSLHLPPGLSSFADVCVESDATTSATDSDDEHIPTAFGDLSLTEEQILRSAPRSLNQLRLKVKCPQFPKKRTSIQEGQLSPKSPDGKFFDSLGSSSASSLLSPSYFSDALKTSLRLRKRRPTQHSQPDAIEPDARPHHTSGNPSVSYVREPGRSVIVHVKTEVHEAVKGWRKLPPRLPIPKVAVLLSIYPSI
ncbi:hypothetical protein DFH29DRAFT_964189 [Suillus ampliporus]|nr:hypothetical protein DFH29DRAFT_964189 [Suillus ampliporus]